MMTTVNNYAYGIYDNGEIWIQTEPRQMEANKGKVYLTTGELRRLLALAEQSEIDRANEEFDDQWERSQ
jgi:hypothetical protein